MTRVEFVNGFRITSEMPLPPSATSMASLLQVDLTSLSPDTVVVRIRHPMLYWPSSCMLKADACVAILEQGDPAPASTSHFPGTQPLEGSQRERV